MKKIVLIIVAVLIVIILAGYFMFAKKTQAPTGTAQNSAQSNPAASDSVASGVKESLLGLMEGATGVKCTVSDASGNYTVIAKGGKARIDGIDYANPAAGTKAGQKGTMINDGTWAYIWSGKEGMKFNIKDMQAASASQGGEAATAKDSDWQDWAKSMDASGAKQDCKPGLATDADFTPPADVKFQDLGEMMKAVQQMQTNPGAIDPSQFNLPQ